jgi:hypothetical protein
MCINGACSLATTCRRSEQSGTVPSDYQSVFWGGERGGECKDYWEKQTNISKGGAEK